jgi:hypothetical protein
VKEHFFIVPVKVNGDSQWRDQSQRLKVNTDVAMLTWQVGLTWHVSEVKKRTRVAFEGGT